tara:strand:- start:421 stop:852 length:432 start_codon:yes stop_codon:yes gene_type:complete
MDKISSKYIKCRLFNSENENLINKNILNFYDYYETKNGKEKFLITNFKKSPHFKSLKSSNFDNYEIYLNLSNQKDHSVSKYMKLINDFDEKFLEEFKIELKEIEYKRKKFYLIIDGLHRVSLYFFSTKNKYLPAKYFKINNFS